MYSSNSFSTTSHSGLPIQDLNALDQAAAVRMSSPHESEIPLPPQGLSQITTDMDTFSISSSSDEDQLHHSSSQPPTRLKKKKLKTPTHHPTPVNKAAKGRMKKLQALGINNFSETGIPYWEPKRLNKDDSKHNTRRQRESLAMEAYLKNLEGKQGNPLPQAKAKKSGTSSCILPQGTRTPIVAIPDLAHSSNTATQLIAEPTRKRHSSSISTESLTQERLSSSSSQYDTLKKDLQHERRVRKKSWRK